MSEASHPRIAITTPSTPGEWAHLEREIIDKLNAAAPEFVARYTRSDGSLIWRDVWPSMDGSDAFFTTNQQEELNYRAFFVQMQGHHQQRDGVLYLQTKNKKSQLQNDALIGHVQSMQIQAGIKENGSIQWYEPYQISERASKNNPHWKQVKAIKIQLKLQKGRHSLELEKIYALRHPVSNP